MRKIIAGLFLISALFAGGMSHASDNLNVDVRRGVVDATTTNTTFVFNYGQSPSVIKDVVLWCPALDAGDTSSLTLTVTPLSAVSASYAPTGWSDKAIGATDDNAYIKANASALSVYTAGVATFTVETSTAQEADRTFYLIVYSEGN